MMHCCRSHSWTDLQSLSGSVSQWLFCLALFHKNICQKQLFCADRNREIHTLSLCECVIKACSAVRPFLSFLFFTLYHVKALLTACNTCLPTCMFELIGFCNIRPSPWPMKTLLSLGSAGQDLLHFSFAPPCLGKQQLPLTFDLWVSILWAAYKLNQIQMTLEVVQCWFGFRSHCWCCFFENT